MISKYIKSLKVNLRNYLLQRLVPSNFYFENDGYCPICEESVTFMARNHWLRDHYKCPSCHSLPRERALQEVLNKYYPNWRKLKIHESSPGNRGVSLKMKNECENYMASQFFVDKPLGMIVNGFRNEDLEQQTFEDHEFDIIITQDVMEHVYEPEKAFKEIARTLKTGGAHIFTVPIINKHFETEQWAVKGENNNPIFLKEAEYHGNPIDPQGSPVTYHWGYDIVDFIQQTSNLETSIEYINNIELGIRAEYIEVLISKKL